MTDVDRITDPRTGKVYKLPRLEPLPPVYRIRVKQPRGTYTVVEAETAEAAEARALVLRRDLWERAIAELPASDRAPAEGLPTLRWRADLVGPGAAG